MSAAKHGNGGSDEGYIGALNSVFERIGAWSYDHRWIVLTGCLVLLGLSAAMALRTRMDNSFEAFFDTSDPVYGAYLEYRDDFGSDEVSYILYEAPGYEHGPWNLEVMGKIVGLGEALEREVPFIQEVTTLVNMEFLDPIPDGIRAGKLLRDFPENQEELLRLRDKVLAKPIYVGGLASRDGRSAAIIIEMEKSSIDPVGEIMLDPERGEALDNLYPQATYHAIEEILAKPEYAGIEFHHTGDVPLNAVINEIVAGEFVVLLGITLLVIAVLLGFFFQSSVGVIGPLVVVMVALLMAVGLVGLLGWNLDMLVGMLPTLLIAVGIADSVHILAEFRAYHAELGDRREALRRTFLLVGTPCLLTSLTTAAGFAAMSIAPIKTIAHFATYAAFGVVAAFLLSVTLLVVFLTLGRRTPRRLRSADEKRRAKEGRFIGRAMLAVARFDLKHPKAILVFSAIIFAVSLVGTTRLRMDANFLNDYSEKIPVRAATLYADEVMGGTNSFIYLFDTRQPDGIKEPAVLREIERLQQRADLFTDVVKKTYSIVDILKDINQTFHGGDPDYHVIPETRELVAQYLIVYEMSGGEEAEEYVSSDYSRASLELRCKWTETSKIEAMVRRLDAYLAQAPLQTSSASETGIGALWMQLMDYMTVSQIRGLLLAFAAISILMCLLFRSVTTGLIAMVPNLSPVVLTLGVMGWLDMPLGYNTLFIAPVAIGIAVDDTMHLVVRYRHEFQRCGDYGLALTRALRDVGRALVITSVILIMGFLVNVFSLMNSQVHFGLLLAGTIVTALVADFILLPALTLILKPFGPEHKEAREELAILAG